MSDNLVPKEKFFSIKWKLSLAFIALTLGIVAIYIFIAKTTFESDKISYIFETQQRQVNQSAQELKGQVVQLIFDSRSILSGYDFGQHKLADMSQKLFLHHESLLGIQVVQTKTNEVLAQLEKTAGAFAQLPPVESRLPASAELDLRHLEEKIFIAQIPDVSATGEAIVMRVLFKVKDLFKDVFEGQELLLAEGSRIVMSSNSNGIEKDLVREYLGERRGDQTEMTQIKRIGASDYLISAASVGTGKMSVYSFISEDIALKATRTLYQRSLMFLIFSFFATVVISMVLSLSLTQNLGELSKMAEQFGKGDFSVTPGFSSRDETGLLAKAFKRMVVEIQQLLTERVHKVRMEEELKTARTVQENLFPREASFRAGNLSLTGLYSTTSECGGDWWYYFQRDRYLYLACADATGHGTPAALVTAAIRSTFSHIELNEMSLPEIANACDEAVYQCSRNALYMTAVFMRINVNTGEGSFINSSHEPPMIFEYDMAKSQITIEDVVTPPGPRLGERNRKWIEHPINVKSGQRLFVYTDGLSSPLNAEGREFTGRRQKKALIAAASQVDQTEFMNSILASMAEFSQGSSFPDDVTFVTIDHNYHTGL
jgi:sigma-B regulation protein RsbU (phosphoserine phosphatase)